MSEPVIVSLVVAYAFVGIVSGAWMSAKCGMVTDEDRTWTLGLNLLLWPLVQLFLRSYGLFVFLENWFKREPSTKIPEAKVVKR